jgi:hypothetical protein
VRLVPPERQARVMKRVCSEFIKEVLINKALILKHLSKTPPDLQTWGKKFRKVSTRQGQSG